MVIHERDFLPQVLFKYKFQCITELFFLCLMCLPPLMCSFQCADSKTRTSCRRAARRGEAAVSTCCLLCESNRDKTRKTRMFHSRRVQPHASKKNRPFVPCDGAVGYHGNHSSHGNSAAQTVVCSPLFGGYFFPHQAGIRERWNQPPHHPTPVPTPPHSCSGAVFRRGAETNGVMVYSHRRPPQVPSRPNQW